MAAEVARRLIAAYIYKSLVLSANSIAFRASARRRRRMTINEMSLISDRSLDEFIKIYKEEFKEAITRAQAREMASRLLTLYGLLAKQLPTVVATEAKSTLPGDGGPPSIGFLRGR